MKFCTYCGGDQHDTKYCPYTWSGQMNRAKLYCTYCGSNSHTHEYCPYVWGGCEKRKHNSKGDYVD